jgi:hypothetical protein
MLAGLEAPLHGWLDPMTAVVLILLIALTIASLGVGATVVARPDARGAG